METPRNRPESQEFQELISSEEKLKELLAGSGFHPEPWDKETAFKKWEEGRCFIADAVNQDGSILDYGCANGFLLRCLQEWTGKQLDPYGLDINKDAIAKARELFPEAQSHFRTLDESDKDFPKTFDIVYWNVWDNYDFAEEQDRLLKRLLEGTNNGGRLILGIYEHKNSNEEVVKQIEKLGYKLSGTKRNPDGEEIIVWFDKV